MIAPARRNKGLNPALEALVAEALTATKTSRLARARQRRERWPVDAWCRIWHYRRSSLVSIHVGLRVGRRVAHLVGRVRLAIGRTDR